MTKTISIIADLRNDNFGDALIFQSIAYQLTSDGYEKIFKLTLTEYSSNNNIEKIPIFRVIKVSRAFFKSDQILFGGGGLIQNDSSNLNLIIILVLIIWAKILGKDIFWRAVGVSKINGFISKLIVKLICILSARLEVRDKLSRKHLGGFTDENILINKDPALNDEIFKLCADCEPPQFLAKHDEYCLISLRPLPKRFKNRNLEEKLLLNISEIVLYLTNHFKLKPIFISFHKKQDLPLIELFKHKYKLKNSLTYYSNDIKEYIYLFKSSQISVSMRLHASVLAHLAKKPFINISYSSKGKALFSDLNYTENIIEYDSDVILDISKRYINKALVTKASEQDHP